VGPSRRGGNRGLLVLKDESFNLRRKTQPKGKPATAPEKTDHQRGSRSHAAREFRKLKEYLWLRPVKTKSAESDRENNWEKKRGMPRPAIISWKTDYGRGGKNPLGEPLERPGLFPSRCKRGGVLKLVMLGNDAGVGKISVQGRPSMVQEKDRRQRRREKWTCAKGSRKGRPPN